jgi:hypothetical protein
MNPEVNPSPERCAYRSPYGEVCNKPQKSARHRTYRGEKPAAMHILKHPFTPEPPSQKNDPSTEERPDDICYRCERKRSELSAHGNGTLCLSFVDPPASTSEKVGESEVADALGDLIKDPTSWNLDPADCHLRVPVSLVGKLERALSRRSTVTPERREYDFNVVRVYCLRHPRTAMGYNAVGFLCGECRAAVTVFGPSEPTVTPEALTTCDGWTPCLRSSVPPVEGRSADRECPECEESGRENCAFHESRRSSHDYER